MKSSRKNAKYADLPASCIFQPIAFETLGTMNTSASNFLSDLGRKIGSNSGEDREVHFFFQRLSLTLQRFNSVLLHNSFAVEADPDL